MSRNHYVLGEWNVTCDVCSRKVKSGVTKKRWDGFRVCPNCFEMRHPQDFVKARQDKISVPDTRPIPTYVYTSIPYISTGDTFCTPSGSTAIPMEAIPGCMIPSKLLTGL